jgi:beta-glucosidase-like glycosyl hydrolase
MLVREAIDQALCNMGLPKEMTEERRAGYKNKTLDRPAIDEEYERVLAVKIRDFVIEKPKAFQEDKQAREDLLAEFKINRARLTVYP